jgi:tetrahydromethanopterin S-methyltransferase subunit E
MNTSELQKAESELRSIRQRVFDVSDEVYETELAPRMDELKALIAKLRSGETVSRGLFSGLTKSELAASRTCEPDWF